MDNNYRKTKKGTGEIMFSIAEAKQVMEKAHEGQTRWDGRPYSIHPEKVVSILKQFGVTDIQVLSAGYLHDTLEDTDLSEHSISEIFGMYVLGLVKQLTFQDSKNDDEIYYKQCRNLNEHAKIIKIADIIANLTDDGQKSDHFIRKRLTALSILVEQNNRSDS